MDDFRPGGKYGSKSPASNGELSTNDIFGGSNNKELAKASAVLSEVTQVLIQRISFISDFTAVVLSFLGFESVRFGFIQFVD